MAALKCALPFSFSPYLLYQEFRQFLSSGTAARVTCHTFIYLLGRETIIPHGIDSWVVLRGQQAAWASHPRQVLSCLQVYENRAEQPTGMVCAHPAHRSLSQLRIIELVETQSYQGVSAKPTQHLPKRKILLIILNISKFLLQIEGILFYPRMSLGRGDIFKDKRCLWKKWLPNRSRDACLCNYSEVGSWP